MKNNSFIVNLATLGPIGYLFAPGTLATLLTLFCIPYLAVLADWLQIIIVIVAFFGAYIIIDRARYNFKEHDPSCIVLDEVIGCLVTFCTLPFSWTVVLLGFLAFRFFDIVKPLGIKSCENFFGAWGILLDDVAAGIISNLLIRVIIYVYTDLSVVLLSDMC